MVWPPATSTQLREASFFRVFPAALSALLLCASGKLGRVRVAPLARHPTESSVKIVKADALLFKSYPLAPVILAQLVIERAFLRG